MTWQTIDTAPLTGEVILVLDNNAKTHLIKLVSWLRGSKEWVDQDGMRVRNVTYWHPITPPPAQKKTDKSRKTGSKNPTRDDAIIKEYFKGSSLSELAKKYQITTGRAWQIAIGYRRKVGGDILSKPEVRS